ncbi:MAG: hypothetical protein V3T17_17735 [Pseudomonadales bacterium]
MKIKASSLQTSGGQFIDALKRGESVEITYHGKTLGICKPVDQQEDDRELINSLEFFGMLKDRDLDVAAEMKKIRAGRFPR